MSLDLGQSLDLLPLEQRLMRYRQFADEALRQAKSTTNPSLRAGYISMASGWQMLAAEVEKAMSRTMRASQAGKGAEKLAR